MRAERDVTQMSWPAASVRGCGRDKAGLACVRVLLLHLPNTGKTRSRNSEWKEKQLSM